MAWTRLQIVKVAPHTAFGLNMITRTMTVFIQDMWLVSAKENSCSSWADDADEDYPPGQEVTVYVNPDNPSEAVLEPGLSGVDWFVCCILHSLLLASF